MPFCTIKLPLIQHSDSSSDLLRQRIAASSGSSSALRQSELPPQLLVYNQEEGDAATERTYAGNRGVTSDCTRVNFGSALVLGYLQLHES